MEKKLFLAAIWCISVIGSAVGQDFGRNKAAYKTFEFEVKTTPNFDIYHYLEDDSLINHLAERAEVWYKYHQEIFQDTFKLSNPVIFYNTHADFQQTNAISGGVGIGTGGVTESLKNRVIMPVTELYAQTDHVLGHELVHAFQYHLMKTSDSIKFTDIANIPLWMTEGLAEYLSIGNVDPHTALWMRDAVINNDFPTLKQLTYSNKYFPYRYGQAFWSFVGGIWGDSIIVPLYKETAKVGYKQAVKNILGLDEKSFSERWKTLTSEYYHPFLKDSADMTPGKEIIGENNGGKTNIAPALSPDGRYIIFSSEKNLFTFDLFLADAQSGKILKTLNSVTRNNHIDEFSFLESAGAWSPYGNRFAFVVFSKGKNKIVVMDPVRGKTVDEFFIPGVDQISNPSWSPDGNTLAFTGLVNGRSDIYLYNIRSRRVENLTNDSYSDLHPSWSPDGQSVVFSSDRSDSFSGKGISLNVISIKDKKITRIPVFEGARNLNPAYSADGSNLYFLSDRDGFRNLYSYSITENEVKQMTDFKTGITGITLYSPALSVARTSGDIAYIYYNRSRYKIYKGRPEEFENVPVNSQDMSNGASTLPPSKRNFDLVMKNIQEGIQSPDTLEVADQPYQPKFKLDYIGNAIGVSVVNSSAGTRSGMNGAVNMIFSDILGDHKLYTAVLVNGEAKDIAGQVAYVNSKKRLGWGAMISHIPYRSGFIELDQEPFNVSEDSVIMVDNLSLTTQRAFQEQVALFSNYVLSQTQRFEFYGSLSRFHFDITKDNNYFYRGIRIGTRRENVQAPGGYTIGELGTAYVLDNSFFGIASPMVGRRFRADLSTTVGEINYTTLSLDKRQYHRFHPFTFAWRLIYINRFGGGANDPRIFPLSYAYPTLTRGNGFDSFTRLPDNDDDEMLINQLFGNQLLVGNIELRLPFTGPERLAVAKSGILFTELALFVDSGLAWNRQNSLSFEVDPSDPSKRAPLFTGGVSLRLNLFGQLVIEPYYAIPLQQTDLRTSNFGINFWPGW